MFYLSGIFTLFNIFVCIFQYCNCAVFRSEDYIPEMEFINNNKLDDNFMADIPGRRDFTAIYPGTKWCGAGNIAKNDDDLGESAGADSCCRAHDKCGDSLEPGETRNNITNTGLYTRLSCDCDETFRRCLLLDGTSSKTATAVGTAYFNLLGTQCYRLAYPITGCKEYSGFTNSKCVEYEFDKTKEKIFQWFDEPNYIGPIIEWDQ